MMAIGDVEPGNTENRSQFLERLRSAQRPDDVLLAIHTGDGELRGPRHGGVYDWTDGGPGIFVKGKDRTEVGLHRPSQGEAIRLGTRMGPLMWQHAVAKGFELDDPQDAAPGMGEAGGRIDELVTVDIKTRSRFATQDPVP